MHLCCGKNVLSIKRAALPLYRFAQQLIQTPLRCWKRVAVQWRQVLWSISTSRSECRLARMQGADWPQQHALRTTARSSSTRDT